MTESRSNRLKTLVSGMALMTRQEARLLTLIMGLLLLGLTVRYVHLRSEQSHRIEPQRPFSERTSP